MARKGTKQLRNRSTSNDSGEDSPIVQNSAFVLNRVPPAQISMNRLPVDSDSIDSHHNPFYLHSSDHPGMSIVSETLTGDNYNSWIIIMRTSLEAKNKISFVDGSLPRPLESDHLFKIWTRCNSMVKAWILNVVSKQIYASILYIQDAAGIWDDLYKRFHKSNLPQIYILEQEISTLRQGTMSLSEYYTKKVTLWERLACTKNLMENGGCRCSQVMKLLDDHETTRITQFLMGLNDDFANIRGQILNMKPRPSLSDMYNMLESDESQRQRTLSNPNPSAFQIKTQLNTYQKSRATCTHCGLSGHVSEKCYKIIGYPPGWKPKNQRQNSNQHFITPSANLALTDGVTEIDREKTLSPEQLQYLVSYLNAKLQPSTSTPASSSATITEIPSTSTASTSGFTPTTCQITGTQFPSIFYSQTGETQSYFYTLSDKLVNMNTWVIDTGATHHVTYDKSLFQEMTVIEDTTVQLANGVGVRIHGLGTIRLNDRLILHDVLFIPQFKFHLLSVSSLTSQIKCGLWFDSCGCAIQDLTRALTIGRGKLHNKLYFLDLQFQPEKETSPTVCLTVKIDAHTWHQRLGHPSLQRLKSMSNSLSISFPKENTPEQNHCRICHLAKQKHLPFVHRNNKTSNAFDLIHIDTWGPFAVASYDGYKYFLTIVDDHSRATWVYLLRNKSEAITVLPGFVSMVETQFGVKVKAVRSDNAPEFNFTKFYREKVSGSS
ncbi:Ribonuclease H-like superfamily [Arabidopsis thaliana x Arabidopsis arenosa]|uniref:Ribonuclease H-like superfamily n=1 Tax=Arabidopsis thaliana x Arabidopsis arenosa TaxID=1240361 RepID=A0A8T1YZS2_9BRAS|nr:Ribonuclease H-like superfamily [Arabidopsis thaliana x Arabidopsis arenosa]